MDFVMIYLQISSTFYYDLSFQTSKISNRNCGLYCFGKELQTYDDNAFLYLYKYFLKLTSKKVDCNIAESIAIFCQLRIENVVWTCLLFIGIYSISYWLLLLHILPISCPSKGHKIMILLGIPNGIPQTYTVPNMLMEIPVGFPQQIGNSSYHLFIQCLPLIRCHLGIECQRSF